MGFNEQDILGRKTSNKWCKQTFTHQTDNEPGASKSKSLEGETRQFSLPNKSYL